MDTFRVDQTPRRQHGSWYRNQPPRSAVNFQAGQQNQSQWHVFCKVALCANGSFEFIITAASLTDLV